MARPRKNAPKPNTQELSLVPEKDQPYPLPEGWKWVRLGELYHINPKSKAEDDTLASFVPMEKIDPGMKGTFSFEVQPWGKIKKGHTQFENGDVAFAKISPCFENGKSMLVHGLKNGLGAGTTELIILRQPKVAQKYTFYLVSSSDFIQKGTRTYSGTVGQQRISMDFVRSYPVPLPSLDEQERIVMRIESLFAKLDEAKEKAEAVLDTFENRKAAILHKAFTGELTAKWREERGIAKESWKKLTLKDVAKWGSGGTPSRKHPEYYTGDIAWVKTGELNNEYLYETEEHITPEAIKNSSAKLFPKETVIIAMYGATIGQCAILGIEATTNQACACAVAKPIIDNKFLFSYLLSQKANFINLGKGGAQPNISQTILKDYPITLPTLIEQQSKEAAEAVLEQIDLMKKAILAKAFRGELGN